jgi:hypothetical protein
LLYRKDGIAFFAKPFSENRFLVEIKRCNPLTPRFIKAYTPDAGCAIALRPPVLHVLDIVCGAKIAAPVVQLVSVYVVRG